MKGIFKVGLALCISLFFAATASAETPDELVELGKTALLSMPGSVSAANDYFEQALDINPDHEKANFWYAVSKMMAPDNDGITLLNNFGFTSADPSRLGQPVSAADFDDVLHSSSAPINPPATFPATSPTATDVQAYLRDNMLVGIESIINNNLSKVTNTSFVDTIVYEEAEGFTTTIEIDYAEVLAVKAAANGLCALIHIISAYNLDNVDIDNFIANSATFNINTFLSAYVNLLLPLGQPGAGTHLTNAKARMETALNSVNQGIDFIKAETDDQSNDLIILDPEDAQDTQLVQENITKLIASLNGTAQDILIPSMGHDDNTSIDFYILLNLSEFFDPADPKNIRSFLPDFNENNEPIRSSFPDPTFGGILPNTTQEDLNNWCGIGPTLNAVMLRWTASDTAEALLEWTQEPDQAFEGYYLYRSTSPDINETSELIATIHDSAVTTYTDTTLDEANNVYYYILYTHYTNNTKTKSKIRKVTLRIYVDINSASPIEDGSKANPFKDLGDALDNRLTNGNGTKFCIAQGVYNEATNSLKLWHYRDGVFFEGGYEGTTWTRDIQAYETVIDASGYGDWSGIGLYNNNNVTIDGLTITGAVGQPYANGIGISQSHSVIIRNCKITDCNRGICVGDGASDVLIDGLTITNITGDEYSGGIEVFRSNSVTIKNCNITNSNRGISIGENTSNVLVENCNIQGRKAQSLGHEGIAIWRAQSVEVKDCTIANSYQVGISINDGSSTIIRNCKVTDNAQRGISIGNSSATILNNLIESNNNEGIYAYGSSNTVSIINNTIVNNKSMGGIYYNSIGTIVIQNNIIANNNGGSNCGIYGGSYSGGRVITNNDSYGHTWKNYYNCGTNAGENGNISADPLFVNQYHLAPISPCVNTGSDTAENIGLADRTTRKDGRLDEGIVDMGYHYFVVILKKDVICDFGDTYGIYIKYNNTGSWQPLIGFSAKSITVGNIDGDAEGKDDIIADFGDTYGIYVKYNNTGPWQPLIGFSAKSITVGNIDGDSEGKDDIIADFGDTYGIYVKYNNTGSWQPLSWLSAKSITVGNIDGDAEGKDDIIADFGDVYGIQIYYNNTGPWQLLIGFSAKSIVVGNIDGDAEGKDDVIIDFGDTYGIYVQCNNTGSWQPLISISAKNIVVGNIDGDAEGKDDIIADFGDTYGIYVKYNNTGPWQPLIGFSAKSITVGNIDGDGYLKEDLIIDFGDTYGIYIKYNNTGSWQPLIGFSAKTIKTANLDAE